MLSSANIDKKKDNKRQKRPFLTTQLYVFTNQKEGSAIAQQATPANYFHDKEEFYFHRRINYFISRNKNIFFMKNNSANIVLACLYRYF